MGCHFRVMLFAVILALGFSVRVNMTTLSCNYYQSLCPNVETIVKEAILPIFLVDPTAPAAFLRLMFHDCQVQGCDASILLDDDGQNMISEMASPRNFGIRKRESIGHVKSILEFHCPGQVSCADTIALAARESVSFSGGPRIPIPLGRKDSTHCSYQEADAYLPSPRISVQGFLQTFMSKGMTIEESIAILGAHTLGVGHCKNIVDRLYDPKPDEQISIDFETLLTFKCPTKTPLTDLNFVTNDITPSIFDNQYFRDVLRGRGLFDIDSRISTDPRTAAIVREFALDQDYFFQVFSSAFVKLSLTNVLTEEEGRVRRHCNKVN